MALVVPELEAVEVGHGPPLLGVFHPAVPGAGLPFLCDFVLVPERPHKTGGSTVGELHPELGQVNLV